MNEKKYRKFRLILSDDKTLKEIWIVRFSRHKFVFLTISITLLIAGLFFALFSYTPLKETIPGYPEKEVRENIITNAVKIDSLEKELLIKDQYISNLRNVINGTEISNDSTN